MRRANLLALPMSPSLRRPEPTRPLPCAKMWIPAFAGMTEGGAHAGRTPAVRSRRQNRKPRRAPALVMPALRGARLAFEMWARIAETLMVGVRR